MLKLQAKSVLLYLLLQMTAIQQKTVLQFRQYALQLKRQVHTILATLSTKC